jgi:hypothetical protein
MSSSFGASCNQPQVKYQKGAPSPAASVCQETINRAAAAIVGYQGCRPGSQNVNATTFQQGQCVISVHADDLYTNKGQYEVALPPSPHNSKIKTTKQPVESKIPGYSGVVPGTRDNFGQTYGRITDPNIDTSPPGQYGDRE